MTTTLSVNEAKANFSSVLADVERNRIRVTIVRYGHPVAQLVPLEHPRRTLAAIPGVAGHIDVRCDLFADDSDNWEACDASHSS